MTLRDLGYRPYQGTRLPPSNSTWVMFRYGLSRALDSILMKLLLAGALLVALAVTAFAAFALKLGGATGAGFEFEPFVAGLLTFQTWFFVGTSALLIGSTAISEDLQNKVFPFFFAKPLTPIQYLIGRVLAVAVLLLAETAAPVALLVLGFSAVAPREIQLESVTILFPALLQAILVAGVCASVSVGISAISKNRAITTSLWLVVWIVPKIVSSIVRLASDHAWLDLTSVPAMLGVCTDNLLGTPEDGDLGLPFAIAGLVAFSAASLFFATTRLERAEVVS